MLVTVSCVRLNLLPSCRPRLMSPLPLCCGVQVHPEPQRPAGHGGPSVAGQEHQEVPAAVLPEDPPQPRLPQEAPRQQRRQGKPHPFHPFIVLLLLDKTKAGILNVFSFFEKRKTPNMMCIKLGVFATLPLKCNLGVRTAFLTFPCGPSSSRRPTPGWRRSWRRWSWRRCRGRSRRAPPTTPSPASCGRSTSPTPSCRTVSPSPLPLPFSLCSGHSVVGLCHSSSFDCDFDFFFGGQTNSNLI